MTVQRKTWVKVAKVIKSLDDLRQVECAINLVKQYKKYYGIDSGLLELELKYKITLLRKGGK